MNEVLPAFVGCTQMRHRIQGRLHPAPSGWPAAFHPNDQLHPEDTLWISLRISPWTPCGYPCGMAARAAVG